MSKKWIKKIKIKKLIFCFLLLVGLFAWISLVAIGLIENNIDFLISGIVILLCWLLTLFPIINLLFTKFKKGI